MKMVMQNLYAAFDVFPSPKGAALHIAHSLMAIAEVSGPVALVCCGYGDMPGYQVEGPVTIWRCMDLHPNFLKRTELYARFLDRVVQSTGNSLKRIHFRDIWSGVALLTHPGTRKAGKIFEVNALASIELPVHYPELYHRPALLGRLRAMEDFCLQGADRIITVSRVTRDYLVGRGVPEDKITVIPNTVFDESRLSGSCPDPTGPPGPDSLSGQPFILYAGTLAPWQGVPTLLEAFSHLCASREGVNLVLACSNGKYFHGVNKMVDSLEIGHRVTYRSGLSREGMSELYRRALVSVAPLARGDRNEVQGCCPVKIIESMAHATAVVASNLAVCREIISHAEDGWLVPPDSPRALAHALLELLGEPGLAASLGRKAANTMSERFGQKHFTGKIRQVYGDLS